MHPEISVRVLYQRDYLHLLVKYGLEPPSQLVDADAPADGPPLRFDVERRVLPSGGGATAESA
ncbi:MAG: hypothetical protein ACT4OX_06900 [Actinomycetota bacterium]